MPTISTQFLVSKSASYRRGDQLFSYCNSFDPTVTIWASYCSGMIMVRGEEGGRARKYRSINRYGGKSGERKILSFLFTEKFFLSYELADLFSLSRT